MYKFHWPTQTVFKANLAQEIGEWISSEDGDSLMIAAPQENWAAPIVEQFKSNLLETGWKQVVIFSEIEPNPSWETVNRGIETALQSQITAILAVGGGSTMDASKVIALKAKVPKLITMPTTAGTGGEISPWAVISNLSTREKDSVIAKWPDLSLLDPVLTSTVPPLVTLYTGIDAFIHGLEAYLSSSSNAITDALALQGMNLIVDHLETAIKSGEDLNARSGMLQGSLLTGAAMLHAGLGLMHAIGNVTGGLYHHFPHGLILMRCLAAVLDYNQSVVGEKYQTISDLVAQIQEVTENQFQQIEVPPILIQKADLQLLAERAVANVNVETNPRPAGIEDVKNIIRLSFEIQ